MKKQRVDTAGVFEEHGLDPFPLPRTMPEGWDLSELIPVGNFQEPDCQTSVDDPVEVKYQP